MPRPPGGPGREGEGLPRAVREPKPPWSAVPVEIRAAVERLLGARVARATRAYGGYAPSATFRLLLADGRRAFYKGLHPGANEHMRSALPVEERVYRELGDRLGGWAPAYLGSVAHEVWPALLLEDLGPAAVPPWTASAVRDAAEDFARFHRRNLDASLPAWLSRTDWQQFADIWSRLRTQGDGLRSAAALAGRRADEAEEWLDVALPVLEAAALRVRDIPPPYTLLHEDTRSDNLRLVGGRLKLFDWNWASAGPPEFDAVALAESVAAEGGPDPEAVIARYEVVLSLRPEAVAATVAGFAAYFSAVAWRPPPPGLPRVRAVQRRQLKACLPWAARLLGLPAPGWVRAIRD